ncbi:glycoside hydrolase family 127 protein [Antarcticibacterium sp. 1MA-6-2]|uniref:glycoside hydrolase family 127 protein n=1 Tax=Antarcticibacterium sp. 1MA-6-2 TaxID=2908210 RepID=UPI001F23EBD5|nr:glycoside hydrolase family 127 protein [Antarcticibacterium sp. 1MA-6-2]UJH90804.1 glycoside hydrolase family 127 protein [Antarcticibacterium sp. 1MA-6-2]
MKLFFADIRTNLLSLIVFLATSVMLGQQSKLETFKLEDVSLEDGPFRNAMLVDLNYILELNPDKLLAPFLREAGLKPKAENYTNWENSGLDGHIGGHYLTALAQMQASAGSKKADSLLTYSLGELKRVQEANGNGYIGGVPGSKKLWDEIENGTIDAASFSLNGKWVPLYNIHKTYAGLRDVYQITGNSSAKKMLIKFSDWMLGVTKHLSEEQMQKILVSEHGGLNEIFADVAKITSENKYLELAYKFSHQKLLNPLASNSDILNGMHANTQIPKVIGFETIAELDNNKDYHDAATYFWDNVVNKRSVAIGGNSVREHFHPENDFSEMISSVQGPETCNTYNMLKLSEKLFLSNADEKYIDYYEGALYNHILSSQHPEKGGFVYFTPMQPGHYRVYSQPQTSFWCCVGSGIENHGKYNEFIYTHSKNELYVNLFIPSTLTWEEMGIKLYQITNFPKEEATSFKIETQKPQNFTLKIRYPSWVEKGEFKIFINDELFPVNQEPGSYVSIERNWKNGDRIKAELPMQITAEKLPDGSNYAALKYGPVVLGTKTGNEDQKGVFADDSRGGHIAEGPQIPISAMLIFLTNDLEDLVKKVKKKNAEDLSFSVNEVIYPEKFKELEFIPFYNIHESRYAIYLPLETSKSYKEKQEELKKLEIAERKLQSRTIDRVVPGEQQPESDHFIKSKNSNTGVHQNRHWRDATGWFSYELKNRDHNAEKLQITYYGKDSGRQFSIYINEKILAEENFQGEEGDLFFSKEYKLPEDLDHKDREKIIIRFEANPGSRTAGIYDVRLLKKQ